MKKHNIEICTIKYINTITVTIPITSPFKNFTLVQNAHKNTHKNNTKNEIMIDRCRKIQAA